MVVSNPVILIVERIDLHTLPSALSSIEEQKGYERRGLSKEKTTTSEIVIHYQLAVA